MTIRIDLSWRAMRDAWANWRNDAARRASYEAIDIETLRDLGLCRSEYESFWTEARSSKLPSRRRLARWQ